MTTHQVLLQLMDCGLAWQESRTVSMEEMLCLLVHHELNQALAALEHEADRIASLPLADEAKQHKRLAGLELRARGLLDRFYREEREE